MKDIIDILRLFVEILFLVAFVLIVGGVVFVMPVVIQQNSITREDLINDYFIDLKSKGVNTIQLQYRGQNIK
ncbi:MAG TPA: hypothetical protein DCL42_10390 [Deltaproteobacteria bacterium]|nr:hypothetical protein [Deltaproteobacteria bacterium]